MSQLREIHRSSVKLSDQDQDQIHPSPLQRKRSKFSNLSCNKVYILLILVISTLLYFLLTTQSCQRSQISVNNENHYITMLKKFQHDSNCYTQGLSFINETHILQSCGLYNASYIQILQYNTSRYPNTITRISKTDLSQNTFFAEGSVLFPNNGLIYLLTWRQHTVFRFKIQNGKLIQKDILEWIYEGWGLTHDNENLIISDGSSNLFITDQKLKVIKTIHIRDNQGKPINYLNQLQYVQQLNGNKYIYANVYLTKKIVKINYLTEKVEQTYDFKDLIQQQTKIKSDQVLNGIAFDKKSQTFLLTGKKWQNFYLVKGI